MTFRPNLEYKSNLCTVEILGERTFEVSNPKGKYTVTKNNQGLSCSCYYHTLSGKWCSHILSIHKFVRGIK